MNTLDNTKETEILANANRAKSSFSWQYTKEELKGLANQAIYASGWLMPPVEYETNNDEYFYG